MWLFINCSNKIICCEIGFELNHILCGRITSCPSFNVALYSQCHQPNYKVPHPFVLALWKWMCNELWEPGVFSQANIWNFRPIFNLTCISLGNVLWICANYLLILNLPFCSHTVLMHACKHPLQQGFLYHFCLLLHISYSILSLLHLKGLDWVPEALFKT